MQHPVHDVRGVFFPVDGFVASVPENRASELHGSNLGFKVTIKGQFLSGFLQFLSFDVQRPIRQQSTH